MKLKCISTGSSGNCYILTDFSGQSLIIDAGVPIKDIKRGLDWNIKNVAGCILSHVHSDHFKSVKDLESIGIAVWKPSIEYETAITTMSKQMGNFNVSCFNLTTLDGKWTHTNTDGSECPCYGFLITHKEMGKMLYITDTELIKWRFKDVNHILLGVNYDKDLVDMDNPKANHVIRGHMSIDTACDFVKTNDSDSLQNVIMCHLSNENANADNFIEKMRKIVPSLNVSVAQGCMEWDLWKGDECPF